MTDTKMKRDASWLTVEVGMLVEIFYILEWLRERGALDKVGLFSERKMEKDQFMDFMDYVQEVADNDELWNGLPEFWERPALTSKEIQQAMIRHMNKMAGCDSGLMPKDMMTLGREKLRYDLNLILTLCDANISGGR